MATPNKNFFMFSEYPEYVDMRSGCKVSWLYYATEEDAKAASKVAVLNARKQAALGYDFGYCAPGSVELKTHPNSPHNGLYEVCVP